VAAPSKHSLEALLFELRSSVNEERAGQLLPSVRELMKRHHASPVTVQRALATLVREGLIVTKPGAGTFVATRAPVARLSAFDWQAAALGSARQETGPLFDLVRALPDTVVNLAAGYPDLGLQPTRELEKAASRAARRSEAWNRAPAEGLWALREWFAHELPGWEAQDVLIVPGGQSALATIFRALTRPGEPIAFESPCYLGALVAARAADLKPVAVPSDAQGMRPDLLENALERSGARLIVCQPTYANPTGAVLAPARRAEVMHAARRAGAFIVEDDYARDLSLGNTAPPPLVRDDVDGRVIYVRSLTKSVAAGLRIAAICARGAAHARLCSARLVEDLFVSGLMQELALALVTSPGWKRHLRQMNESLVARRDALVARLRGTALAPVIVPRGGFSLWLSLPPRLIDSEVAQEAERAGVRINAGSAWFPADAPKNFIRLSTMGANASALERGADLLASVVERLTSVSP
jgi:DNA-binding transcriptional MocR family regulator